MGKVVFLSVLTCVWLYAGPKSRIWQVATVVRIGHSVSETEETEYKSGQTATGAETSNIVVRRRKVWIYAFKADHQLYLGRREKRPVEGLNEGDQIRVAVEHAVVYVLTREGKQYKLTLVNSE